MLTLGALRFSVRTSAVGQALTPGIMPWHELSGTAMYAATSYCLVPRIIVCIGWMWAAASRLGVLTIARLRSRWMCIIVSRRSTESDRRGDGLSSRVRAPRSEAATISGPDNDVVVINREGRKVLLACLGLCCCCFGCCGLVSRLICGVGLETPGFRRTRTATTCRSLWSVATQCLCFLPQLFSLASTFHHLSA